MIGRVGRYRIDAPETWRRFGWGPWNVYEHVPPALHDQHLHGAPASYSMIGAECEVQPGLVFELIQPLEGDSIYKEHLEPMLDKIEQIEGAKSREKAESALGPVIN